MKDSESGLVIECLDGAKDDLDNITDYYQDVFGEESARKVYEQIRASIMHLKLFPHSGRPSKDRVLCLMEYKEWYSGRFVVIYRADYAAGKLYVYHIAVSQTYRTKLKHK